MKEKEYPFKYTGDRVDILFSLKSGSIAVVEIETDNALPWCFQAMKYKLLKCLEDDLPTRSRKVVPYLVAWNVTEKARSFCRKHGVEFYEIKP